jgi:hypothetical protein
VTAAEEQRPVTAAEERPVGTIAAPSHRPPAGRLRRLLPSIAVNHAVPLLAYLLLRPHLDSDAAALAIGTAVPVVFTLAMFGLRRRVDPVGAVAVLGYGVALLVLLLSGGNDLALKLHEAVVTGPIGLICLVSVAVGRPLHLLVLRFLARNDPRVRVALRDPARRRTSAVLTLLVGAVMLVHALALLALALAQPTTTYLALSRPVGWSIIAVGAAALLWYRNRIRSSGERERGRQPRGGS